MVRLVIPFRKRERARSMTPAERGAWVGVIALHVPALLIVPFYLRHAALEPVKSRRPHLLAFMGVSATLLILAQASRCVLTESIPPIVDVFVCQSLLVFLVEGLFVFTLTLYVANHRARKRVALRQRGPLTGGDANRAQQEIRYSNIVSGGRFVICWIALQWIILLAFMALYALAHADLTAIPGHSTTLGTITFSNLCLMFRVPTLTATITLLQRLRISFDGWGTRLMLWRTVSGCLVAFLLHGAIQALSSTATSSQAPSAITIVVIDFVLYSMFVRPILDLRRYPSVGAGDPDAARIGQLERFLCTPVGFESFKTHLMDEFCVESLYFWRDVKKYRAHPSAGLAEGIFRLYLNQGAPLEVNLPSPQIKLFRNVIFLGGAVRPEYVRPGLFDDAVAGTMSLMESGAFVRYLDKPHAAWDNFVAHHREQTAMDAVVARVADDDRGDHLAVAMTTAGTSRTGTAPEGAGFAPRCTPHSLRRVLDDERRCAADDDGAIDRA